VKKKGKRTIQCVGRVHRVGQRPRWDLLGAVMDFSRSLHAWREGRVGRTKAKLIGGVPKNRDNDAKQSEDTNRGIS